MGRKLTASAVDHDWWEVSFRAAPQLVLAEALVERGALAEAEEVLASALELASSQYRIPKPGASVPVHPSVVP